ncbi:MAG: PorV/PorQ family protein [Nitrososphaera sp.]|nr:PorV/PorQ family protein [Nitrososphaera sp.]MCI0706117.1 PorV/PorQ family protein [Ignavibacteriota bacterium]
MGESFVAEPGRLGSFALNPANMQQVASLEILLSHTEWIQDITSEYFAIAYPVKFGTIAFAVSNTNNGGIEIRDTPGPPLSTFTARSSSFQASYATAVAQNIGLGISAKFLYDKLYVEEATGFAFDAGVLYSLPIKGLVVGASVANVGQMSAFVTEDIELPLTARVGASYQIQYDDDFAISVGSLFASEQRAETARFHVGAEASYQNLVALRLGYQSGYDTRSISGGLGVNFDWLQFDYGYVPFSHGLGTAHVFTLGFRL